MFPTTTSAEEAAAATAGATAAEAKSGRVLGLYMVIGLFPVVLSAYATVQYLLTCVEEQVALEAMTHKLPDLIAAAIPVFVVCVASEAVADAWAGTGYYRLNDAISSLSAGMTQQATGALIKAAGIFPYAWVHTNMRLIEVDASSWLVGLGVFLAVEHGYYCMHRFAHEWNLGWAGHVVHHSSEEYNLTTALRQGVLQPFFSWMFYVPYALIFPLELYVLHNQINTLYQFWIHTRFITRLPWPLELVFNTPSHHRVHHGRNEQYIDKNYGGTLIIFDRLYGTFEPEDEDVIYGITHSLETWNPVYIQSHHLIETVATAVASTTVAAKVRTFLDYGPGYNYRLANHEALQSASACAEPKRAGPPTPRIRHDAGPASGALAVYCGLSVTMAILEIADQLKLQSRLSLLDSSLYGAYVIFHVTAVSLILDGSVWAWLVVPLRWIAYAALAANTAMPQVEAAFGGSFALFALSPTTAWVVAAVGACAFLAAAATAPRAPPPGKVKAG
ncbi:transmembrane protein 195 [Thecamonas trahens ATCC 50062]|uniref:Transmembrane protein 195 n=1 Tax=Thecamonas trahens ATCC 50062 TaxID=461836 RepID=A0A0L0DA41_THETB|nr:transmembrane protein 195 [Thecamonas trahens ATCC 50062]KNC49224.1 transmembrane protein 195 [Thecamonas trahens ATCC 50062]|eukprot:XP_013757943.1 transmembrane protein 195 [Thecamonas trahens ATCC 50062]